MKKNTLFFLLIMFITSFGHSQGIDYNNGVVLRTSSQENKNYLQTPRVMSAEDCGQETLSNDFETSLGSLKNYVIANDFVVNEEMGVFTLESITFHAFVELGGDIDEVDYVFYEDSENGPGNQIVSLEDVEATSVELIGEYEDDEGQQDVLEVYLELEEPIIFEAEEDGAVYWIGIQVPNYEGSSISFELISELETPNETYVYLAGDWHGVESLFGVTRDGVMTLSGTCSVAIPCTEVSAGILEGPDSICPLTEFIITPLDATSGVSGVSYTWEQARIEQNTWLAIEGATSLNLNMEEGISQNKKFRLTMTCESGSTDTSEPLEVTLKSAEECYCEPTYTLGCSDGDAINQVIIEDPTGEIIFQNDSGCSETGYTDYSQELEAIEVYSVAVGLPYTMTITSETEYPGQNDVRVWWDVNNDGIFSDEEEIGNSAGQGLDENGEFSFQFNGADIFTHETQRIRIRMAWLGGDDIEPCGNKSYGEAEDYSIVVVATVGVEDHVFNEFSFYPNPVEDKLNLSAETPIENLKVYNMLGQEVLQVSPNTSDFQLQTRNLPSSTYLLKVTLEGVEKTYKLIVK